MQAFQVHAPRDFGIFDVEASKAGADKALVWVTFAGGSDMLRPCTIAMATQLVDRGTRHAH